ncbi:MAG TPA: HD domain-containing phosphohydrolase [Syntrophales bacterium]|nr:HD domain-containing phosphohydrolase [Syntrophales bacterium]HOM07190.1 HD domain-containing phosphohydrolase [Syntrophales bacterium]HOO00232.1 HD domain-containing phosphohydrolase [Syntrophales bacterium]HPC01379.1 HD domain-containing phosphohydrolase [Syntrophales bacterium]HPQ06731.1 HD domain-containing phosphohydrolase [Syntrophales bacterium]
MPRRPDPDDLLGKIGRLSQIGVALTAERNIDRLLEMIIEGACDLTRADGGTLYILSEDADALRFAIVRNETLKIKMGGTGTPITWPAVALHLPDGRENRTQVSAYAALTGQVVNIPDVYNAEGFDFSGTREFDGRTGYRSRSMLVVPMRDHEGELIGVLQLLNARDEATGEVTPFSAEARMMAESLSSQAAVALSQNRLIRDLEELLESFITSIAAAIDEKSPYTGGHIRRVAELSLAIAGKINECTSGPFAAVRFTDDELKELRFAAWLHDVGKITTPEYIVDKATKLEALFDRLEVIKLRARFAAGDRGAQEGWVSPRDPESGEEPLPADASRKGLEEDLAFLEEINRGDRLLTDVDLARIREIAARRCCIGGEEVPLLTAEEVENLSIRQGTLTGREREIINNHVRMTIKILSSLPFPRKLKRVPLFAGAHHEKLDGTGYPQGLKGDLLPLQARILAFADVFEALTAKDRPYKKGKTVKEALRIMEFMVKDGHIDGDIYDLFVREGIYRDYGERELSPHQRDL